MNNGISNQSAKTLNKENNVSNENSYLASTVSYNRRNYYHRNKISNLSSSNKCDDKNINPDHYEINPPKKSKGIKRCQRWFILKEKNKDQ